MKIEKENSAGANEIINDILSMMNDITGEDYVFRWNGRHAIQKQNIAEHHAHVSQILLKLFNIIHVPESDQLSALKRALVHDLPEIWLSDIPCPAHERFVKLSVAYDEVEDSIWNNELVDLKSDGAVEKHSPVWKLVKFADRLDRLVFVKTEMLYGNNAKWVKQAYEDETVACNALLCDIISIYGLIDRSK